MRSPRTDRGAQDKADLVTIVANEGTTAAWIGRTAVGAIAMTAVTPHLGSLAGNAYGLKDDA